MPPRMDPSKAQIVTFALDRRPRATRASGSKVRTGCKTCKKRHVKCDEAKPQCMRCLKSKGNCEGYERRTPEPPTSKRLAPKPSTPTPEPKDESSNASTPKQTYLQSPPPPSTFNAAQFTNEREKAYFDQWLIISRSMTGGLVPSDFWAKAIPQASYGEKAVRSAALAVGALSSALMSNIGPRPLTKEELYKTEYYTDALTYHAEALRLVREATSRNGVRIAVVCCILFFVYTAMAEEEEETALRHLIHGTMILEQFIDNYFRTSINMIMMVRPSSSSSSMSMTGLFQVEDEIFQVFNRIAYNFLVHKYLLQPRTSVSGPIFLHQPVTRQSHEIPRVFDDLVQARRWWDLLLARTGDSARSRLKLSTQYPYPDWVAQPEAARDMSLKHPRQDDDDLDALEAWHSAFGPLYHRACDTQQEQFDDFIRAVCLEVQFLTHRASTRCLGQPDYDTVASLTPDFAEIVRLLSILLYFQVPSFVSHDAVFTLDMGHVLPLHLVAVSCRDAVLRARATDLLDKYPRRDGLWDSRGVVAMARLSAIIEEENLAEGDGREQWDRLKHREVAMDCSRHRGTLRALRMDESGIWVMRTETFAW